MYHLLSALRFALHRRLRSALTVALPQGTLRFLCNSQLEEMRVNTIFTKEEGTIAWLRDSLRPGDILLDVGANNGIYSLFAASLLGRSGKVFAVEPHAVNLLSLMQNIAANEFQDRIRVLSCPLHDQNGLFEFNYFSLEPGSSMSQLGGAKDADEREFRPAGVELKIAASVDRLIEEGTLPRPHHIKIDVDGNELQVLNGMRRLLCDSRRPQTLQVEINRRAKQALYDCLDLCGYRETGRHYTAAGKAALARGEREDEIPYNAIFRPSEA